MNLFPDDNPETSIRMTAQRSGIKKAVRATAIVAMSALLLSLVFLAGMAVEFHRGHEVHLALVERYILKDTEVMEERAAPEGQCGAEWPLSRFSINRMGVVEFREGVDRGSLEYFLYAGYAPFIYGFQDNSPPGPISQWDAPESVRRLRETAVCALGERFCAGEPDGAAGSGEAEERQ